MQRRFIGFTLCVLVLTGTGILAERDKPAEKAKSSVLSEQMRFGVMSAQNGLWKEARFRFERVLAASPENACAHNNLAVAYEGLKDYEKARFHYDESKRLAPKNRHIADNSERFEKLCDRLNRVPQKITRAESPAENGNMR